MKEKPCRQCGALFVPSAPNTVYCEKCHVVGKPCKRCGVARVPIGGNKNHCPSCQKALYRLLHPLLPRKCKQCGVTFTPRVKLQLYCLPKCNYRAKAARCKADPARMRRQRKWNRTHTLSVKYGITEEDYNRMFEAQRGRCAICGKHQQDMKRRLSVDHDHETGKVRALLCLGCNALVGRIETSPEVVEECYAYVERHKTIRLAEVA